VGGFTKKQGSSCRVEDRGEGGVEKISNLPSALVASSVVAALGWEL
jgi:hypothetical protein